MKLMRCCTVSMSLGFVSGMIPMLEKEGYEVVLLSSAGQEHDDLHREYGVRCIAVEMERHISPWRDLKSLFRLIRVMRRERPDIVHSMTPKAGLLCMMAAKMAGVPVRIHTFTGLVFPTSKGLKRKILMFTDRLTCACATHIIPEGEGVRNDLIDNGITRKPLKVLGYGNVRGIDMERFSRRADVMRIADGLRDESQFTFLFVGRIVGDKGINELVHAFVRLHQELPKTRLWLVGWLEADLDPVTPETLQLINSCDAIVAPGTKGGDELLAWYAATDCFVFPSYREGFPNTVMEAGAMGLPSIVTDINGSREIIREGENGTIIPSHDEESLLNAMRRMVDDKVWRDGMASNARDMIGSRYEQGYVRRCLVEYYQEINSKGN